MAVPSISAMAVCDLAPLLRRNLDAETGAKWSAISAIEPKLDLLLRGMERLIQRLCRLKILQKFVPFTPAVITPATPGATLKTAARRLESVDYIDKFESCLSFEGGTCVSIDPIASAVVLSVEAEQASDAIAALDYANAPEPDASLVAP